MTRETICAAGGLAIACATAYSLALLAQPPAATSLDLRWLYTPVKADRLPVTQRPPADQAVVAFDLPAQNTTIVAKGPVRFRVESAVETPRPRVRTIPVQPVRELPSDEAKKEKLPEGCEPAFSPVTTPAFAHIGVRCDS